ncbi:MAG: NADH-quinone oxidoreductase subunit C [Arenicellales bacterium WSBS_2016_MAG_OTU3]
MASVSQILETAQSALGENLLAHAFENDELTLDVSRENVRSVCAKLKDEAGLQFEQLIDLCGVDYSTYGEEHPTKQKWSGARFAVVYHLLSVSLNHRVRVRAFINDDPGVIESVISVWPVADWFEREAFDLYGIIFDGHPDLRRLLTDYGFIGHPFRKDFPISGHVEMRYDEEKGRVIYQPVTIEPRVLVPRVIREEGFGDRNP